jgi:hypothetical protein
LNRKTWRCWVCAIGEDAAELVKKVNKCDFPTAVKFLADRAGVASPSRGVTWTLIPLEIQPPPSFLPARSESGPRTPTRTGAKSTRGRKRDRAGSGTEGRKRDTEGRKRDKGRKRGQEAGQRAGSGTGPILLSQASFLLAHIANSGPLSRFRFPAFAFRTCPAFAFPISAFPEPGA